MGGMSGWNMGGYGQNPIPVRGFHCRNTCPRMEQPHRPRFPNTTTRWDVLSSTQWCTPLRRAYGIINCGNTSWLAGALHVAAQTMHRMLTNCDLHKGRRPWTFEVKDTLDVHTSLGRRLLSLQLCQKGFRFLRRKTSNTVTA